MIFATVKIENGAEANYMGSEWESKSAIMASILNSELILNPVKGYFPNIYKEIAHKAARAIDGEVVYVKEIDIQGGAIY